MTDILPSSIRQEFPAGTGLPEILKEKIQQGNHRDGRISSYTQWETEISVCENCGREFARSTKLKTAGKRSARFCRRCACKIRSTAYYGDGPRKVPGAKA